MGDRSVFQQGGSAPQNAQTKDVWFGARGAQSKETEITRTFRTPGAGDPGKRRGLVRSGDRLGSIRIFEFVKVNQASYPIVTMCRLLEVSTSGYYAWRDRRPSARAEGDGALLARIKTIHAASRRTYGAPRIHAELAAEDIYVGRKRIARLMRAAGLKGVSRRKGIRTTKRADDAPSLDPLSTRVKRVAAIAVCRK